MAPPGPALAAFALLRWVNRKTKTVGYTPAPLPQTIPKVRIAGFLVRLPMIQSRSMDSVVTINPKVLGGVPCFAGTRVPVKALFDHLESGYNIDYFLMQFPSVTREQVQAVLENSRQKTEQDAVLALRQ